MTYSDANHEISRENANQRNHAPASIPTPAHHLGFEPGEDRKLADWPELVDYFTLLSQTSDRVKTIEIGRTTEDNPLLLTIISSLENIANLDECRRIQQRLADPRSLTHADAARLIPRGKAIVAITCSIHATEVGAAQMSPLLAHRLAASHDPDIRRVLDNAILLLIPSLNPDGLIHIKRWYESTLGENYEGVMPPFLYHKYTGHDNNRDWFMLTQRETRLAVERCLNIWHPHILLDMHQTRANGSRMILPPFVDPVGPNVDPILQAQIAMLGSAIAADMTAQGKAGVAMNVVYDAYSPNRTYQHYHAGIRLLTEAAGVRIATPVNIRPRDLQSDRGETPTRRTWNHPLPWRGGAWRLRDIVDYDHAAAYACLSHAARLRDTLVRNFYQVSKNAVQDASPPYAYIIPPQQHDARAAAELLAILRAGLVEIRQATAAFTADGETFPAASRVILRGQPYWQYAKTLMEQRKYPDIRTHPGGPPKAPYDVTAHCLPIQMGVNSYAIQNKFAANLKPLTDHDFTAAFAIQRTPTHPRNATSPQSAAYVIPPESNAAAYVVNRILAENIPVSRAAAPFAAHGAHYRRGAFVTHHDALVLIPDLPPEDALLLNPVQSPPETRLTLLRQPRIALYKSHIPALEFGWTRYVLDEYNFPYALLTDADIRQDDLAARFDAILLPHQRVRQIHKGHGASYYHPAYAGGLGDEGAAALRRFAEQGGTLITWDGSSRYAVQHLELPARNVLAGLSRSEFYAPGSLLAILLDAAHPLAYGMPQLAAAMFYDGPAFDIRRGRVIGKFPLRNPLFSGLLIGPERLYNRAALATVPLGKGEVVLMAFRPHFRAQARGTYKILFNALYAAAQA